jgi:demethylmenaquinone methyltransferase / 2-methoxy-6-polyprenyl-1,4-benzoquinol methylase
VSAADLSKTPADVAAMFDQASRRYDLMNTLLSGGNAQLWRAATVKAVAPRAGERILDLAAGTGTSSEALARTGARVVAADFSKGMLAVGRQRHAEDQRIEFVFADAQALPFGDDEFDGVTISFGLRNVADPHRALAEMFRVTKPGGRIVVCEFSKPTVAPFRAAYFAYLDHVMPTVSRIASSNAPAYGYLGDSIKEWADQTTLASWLREAGYRQVRYRNLTGGIVALHRGIKPSAGVWANE